MNRNSSNDRTSRNGRAATEDDALAGQLASLALLLQRQDNGAAGLQCLGLTSCFEGEGVSTVAAHLARALADLTPGRVLLVDANVADPGLARKFNLPPAPGLVDACRSADSGQVDFPIHEAVVDDLHVLTAGVPAGAAGDSGDDAASIVSRQLPRLLDPLRDHYQRIVFDLPPLEQLASCLDLAVALDGVLLVIESGRASRREVSRGKLQLERAGTRLAGAVLNKHRRDTPAWLGG